MSRSTSGVAAMISRPLPLTTTLPTCRPTIGVMRTCPRMSCPAPKRSSRPWSACCHIGTASSRPMCAGKRVVIAAHGNSLRALVKYLDDISGYPELNIDRYTPGLRVDEISVPFATTTGRSRGGSPAGSGRSCGAGQPSLKRFLLPKQLQKDSHRYWRSLFILCREHRGERKQAWSISPGAIPHGERHQYRPFRIQARHHALLAVSKGLTAAAPREQGNDPRPQNRHAGCGPAW